MPCTIKLSQDFVSGYQQSSETSARNLADLMTVKLKKLAPFARPSQYPNGYPGTPGTLVGSIHREGQGMEQEVVSSVAYAKRRNYENDLNPQTKHYVERGIDNALRGKQSQWWRASSN